MLRFSRLINSSVYVLVLEATIGLGVFVTSSSSVVPCDVAHDITLCERPFPFSFSVLVSFSVFRWHISYNLPHSLVVYCIDCISNQCTVAFDGCSIFSAIKTNRHDILNVHNRCQE
jgi:hypothetical protein